MDKGKGRMASCTCAAVTDGMVYNGFRAAAITVGVYVLVCEMVCTKHQAQEALQSCVILARPLGLGA